ncbi:hypothetical protein [Jannaschia sp. S6380]|nr:hypothetical protein [Jannaschia sp. S6380]
MTIVAALKECPRLDSTRLAAVRLHRKYATLSVLKIRVVMAV